MKYLPTIGMEVHVELATKSKMFCSCENGLGMESQPNKHICPVCSGQPGAIPVPNEEAIKFVIKAGLSLNCAIARHSKFDRKNYFYPDLPKGYQISQFDQPLCENGALEIDCLDGNGVSYVKKVGITRIHLEEDTGKLIHQNGTNESLVDFNRAGVPLMELVTEPDIVTAQEAKKFCEELRLIFRHIGISPADMEKGQMRCEANISLYEEGKDRLSGTKVELKNLNSFKAVERGILYEINRQTALLESGEKIIQETRGWNEDKGESFSQRQKEESHDYRYFPEPDILPLKFTDEEIESIRISLPEMPGEKRSRFSQQFGIRPDAAAVIVSNKELSHYYENVTSELENWMSEAGHDLSEEERIKLYQLAANYLVTELQRHLFTKGRTVHDLKITPENFAELIKIIYKGEINSSAAQTVITEMFETGADPSHIIEEKNLVQTSDEGELGAVIDAVIAENEKSVIDFKNGKENALKFLMGQVMRKTQGKANPQVVQKLLQEKLV
jgi:aspartyl-tRNA(Asn)/glutamyl-tRNA(Gln) amidotransferase subunit B